MPIMILSPVSNFGDQSLSYHNCTYLPLLVNVVCELNYIFQTFSYIKSKLTMMLIPVSTKAILLFCSWHCSKSAQLQLERTGCHQQEWVWHLGLDPNNCCAAELVWQLLQVWFCPWVEGLPFASDACKDCCQNWSCAFCQTQISSRHPSCQWMVQAPRHCHVKHRIMTLNSFFGETNFLCYLLWCAITGQENFLQDGVDNVQRLRTGVKIFGSKTSKLASKFSHNICVSNSNFFVQMILLYRDIKSTVANLKKVNEIIQKKCCNAGGNEPKDEATTEL